MTRLVTSHRASRVALVAAATLVGFVLLVLARPGGPDVSRNVDDLLQAVAPLLVALPLCLWRASTSSGRMRTFWRLLGASAAAWGAGQLAWCYLEIVRHMRPTASGVPTAGYLLCVVCAGAALLVYPGPRLHWAGRSRALIDGLLIVTTLLFVSWTIASDTGALERTGAGLAERLTVLAYPAADIVLLAMLVTVFGRGRRSLRDPLLVVGGCLVLLFLGDSLSVYMGLSGTYQTGSVIDVCWVAAFLVLGLAALVPPLPADDLDHEGHAPTWTEFIAYGPLALALVMGLVQMIRGDGFDVVEEALIFASIVLLVVRGALFVLENRVLVTRIESTISDLEWLTLHDPLTGLANRVLFGDRLGQAIAGQQRDPHNMAVAYLDLDDFKGINDSLGHDVGDELLAQVAQRMAATVREGDTLARLSGDEFALLLTVVDDGDQVEEMLGRILSRLERPFAIGTQVVAVSASIGYSLSFGHIDAEELLKQADEAMYSAKDEGKDRIRRYRTPEEWAVEYA